MPAATAQADPHTMQCLEVWGGNEAVDHGVVMPGLDAWLYSRPYQGHKAGGDLHYVSSCAAGLVTRILVADVSGHGESVAGMAVKLRGLMRQYVNFIDQSRLVVGLNREFGDLSESGGFATAIAATYVAPADTLTVSNAGHPLPLMYRTKTKTWCTIGGTKPSAKAASRTGPANTPLGIIETEYDEEVVKFVSGDLVVIYTDSLIEAMNEQNEMLGSEGLLNLVREIDPSNPQELMQSLLAKIEEAASDPHAADDVTVLIVRANDLRPTIKFRDKVHTNLLMLRMGLGKLLPGSEKFPWPEAGPLAKLGAFLHRIKPNWGMAASLSTETPGDES